MKFTPALLVMLLASTGLLKAQNNYEIQVYGSETVAPGSTMFELHSNYTFSGSTQIMDGMLPTQGAWHETVEITHGWTSWFETGLYIFTAVPPGGQWNWVGDHIRPRVRVPESWHWPVGASISLEAGYQRRLFSPDTWTLEIRPIIDKQVGRWYLAFNPSLDRSFHGPSVPQGLVFSPNFKAGFDFTKWLNAGLEYYGSVGPVTDFLPIGQQQQQIVPAFDLNVSPKWEFNFGVGVGVTHGTDHLIVKWIIGRRFDFGSKKLSPAKIAN